MSLKGSSSPKVLSLTQLAQELDEERGNKTIVHCHGVFDLIHIGHIRYLQRAKNLGDILVVTVTPDRFVNKGPHRPAFTETIRVEVLASMDCVDYVAINQWPTAGETLELLRPNIYAKGAEYQSNRTPEVQHEERVLDSIGAEMAYIEDVTSSSSSLLNAFFSPFTEEVENYLKELSQKYTAEEVLRPLRNAESLKVLVVGETIIDEYYYCSSLNRSSKAPVVAMQYNSHERFAGGAAAVANHVAAFCKNVTLVSMLGAMNSEEDWVRSHLKDGINASFIYKEDSPSITKRRYRESYFNAPVFEVYTMNDAPLSEPENKGLYCLLSTASQYDLVIAIDFGHGMLGDLAIRSLCDQSKFLAVNTQTNAGNMGYHTISKYPRANFITLAEGELRLEFRNRSGDLHPMLESVFERLRASSVFVTRGTSGCLSYCDEVFLKAPALAVKIADRVGAGDTFLAVSSLCAALNTPMDITAFLGNVAGAEAVATVGHRRTLEMLPFARHVESLLK